MTPRRVVLLIFDSLGIGEMPDAAEYGDAGSDTLGHIAASRPLLLPNLCMLGLANIRPFENLAPAGLPLGCYGRCALASPGKEPGPLRPLPASLPKRLRWPRVPPPNWGRWHRGGSCRDLQHPRGRYRPPRSQRERQPRNVKPALRMGDSGASAASGTPCSGRARPSWC